jgi:hypothetical protein
MTDREREALITRELYDWRSECALAYPGEAPTPEDIASRIRAALAAREEPQGEITVWTCMSCGSHGEGQSCRECGHEAMPGRWLSAEGVERQLKDAWQQRDEALAAREDTERPDDGERIQELEEVVRACRSALICREALTPLFAEKIRAVLRDTEQEHE